MRRPPSTWTGNRGVLAAVAVLLSLLSAVPAAAEKRIALVVGNSAYQNNDGPETRSLLALRFVEPVIRRQRPTGVRGVPTIP
jgi:hypothetical protein